MKTKPRSVRPFRQISVNHDKNPLHSNYKFPVLIGTPTTGLVRYEWANARYTQLQPTNWSQLSYDFTMNAHAPLRFQVADAQNLIVRMALEKNCEWLILHESDNLLEPFTFYRFNEYMVLPPKERVPIVSGLYFTRSDPPEPMVYREFGQSFFTDWKMGDKVWVKGCPTGCLLIHCSILRAMWNESPEYTVSGQITREVFHTPHEMHQTPGGGWMLNTGTSDLHFCDRLVKERIFEKAGWPEFQKKEHPVLIDTNIFSWHIEQDGTRYPLAIPQRYLRKEGEEKCERI